MNEVTIIFSGSNGNLGSSGSNGSNDYSSGAHGSSGLRRMNATSGKIILYRNFDLQLSESFIYRPKAEFLLIANSSMNRSKIELWVFMRKFDTEMMIWNIKWFFIQPANR